MTIDDEWAANAATAEADEAYPPIKPAPSRPDALARGRRYSLDVLAWLAGAGGERPDWNDYK